MDGKEPEESPRRGRPRKWASEEERRSHEAAKRRLRSRTQLTAAEFNDVVAMNKLLDELQRSVEALTTELDDLKLRHRQLQSARAEDVRRLEQLRARDAIQRVSAQSAPASNRAQRRAAERAGRREP